MVVHPLIWISNVPLTGTMRGRERERRGCWEATRAAKRLIIEARLEGAQPGATAAEAMIVDVVERQDALLM
jgi:hypothetical protein